MCDFLLACPAGARADTRLFPSLIVIPKRNSVFSVELNGFTSFIYGSKFEQRASERSAKKFKVRGTIDLWRFWRTVHLNIHPGGTTVMEVTSVDALSSQQSPVTSAMDATTGSTQSCHAHSCPFSCQLRTLLWNDSSSCFLLRLHICDVCGHQSEGNYTFVLIISFWLRLNKLMNE